MTLDELIAYWTLKGTVRYNDYSPISFTNTISIMLNKSINSFINYNTDYTINKLTTIRIHESATVESIDSKIKVYNDHNESLEILNGYVNE